MNVNRIRLRLTLGYVGIFALILLFLGGIAVFGFSQALISQQDELLSQEARNTTKNLLKGNKSELLATGSDEFGWIALEPDGSVMDQNWTTKPLGIPDEDLLGNTLQKKDITAATVQGTKGSARVVSRPMYDDSGELVGVMQYARSLRSVRDTVNELILVLLPLSLGALGLATLGGAYMSGRAVRPVRESFDRQRAFIADASHELKTPLTLIRADTEVLQRGLHEPGDRELASDVLSETDKMTGMVSNLLLVARLDAGKLPLDIQDFGLTGVVLDAAGRFEKQAAEAGIRLTTEVPGKVSARGDPARTAQILGVLLDNALAHTPEGGEVLLALQTEHNAVEVIVRDTGAGIPPEHLTRIFERFYRADTSRSRDSGGTGLGLSIARDLARVQEGDLIAANAEVGGAVFRLRLPAG